jgi:hypothetical protein
MESPVIQVYTFCLDVQRKRSHSQYGERFLVPATELQMTGVDRPRRYGAPRATLV